MKSSPIMIKVLAIGGSVRSNPNLQRSLVDLASNADGLDSLKSQIQSHFQILSNTEVMVAVALLGSKLEGAEIDYLSLNDISLRDETEKEFSQNTIKRIQSATAILLVSPVYFGDRSSLMAEFLQATRENGCLREKVIATLSVGAKRNGGQETTNIFMMHEAITMGAFVIGNGPPSSQYGGTVQGGDKGAALSDEWGLMTAFETGRRVSQIAAHAPSRVLQKCDLANVGIFITMDTLDGFLSKSIEQMIQDLPSALRNRVKVHDLSQLLIEPCIACDICPVPYVPVKKERYGCVIKNSDDAMNSIQKELLESDGIILAGLNLKKDNPIKNHYQNFIERTRFIRRNDFELTNVPVTSLLVEEVGATQQELFSLRVMTSMLRHNCLICPPIKGILYKEELISSPIPGFQEFMGVVAQIRHSRLNAQSLPVSYKAGGFGGYKDDRLDDSTHFRV